MTVAKAAQEARLRAEESAAALEEARRPVYRRVLEAFRAECVAEADWAPTTGYAYGAPGRAKLDRLFARALQAEAALVRPQIVSGTHALTLALFALVRPGEEVLVATGEPYDTLRPVLGLGSASSRARAGNLPAWGVACRVVDVGSSPTAAEVAAAVGPRTRLVLAQRSRGYSLRPALGLDALAALAEGAHRRGALLLVDNCYGEFCRADEPTAVGADLLAGSLIKNPGGGLAPTGGYVAGRRELVEQVAERLTAPGLGGEVGAAPEGLRPYFQGLFLAPHTVGQALRGALFAAHLFARLGFPVLPGPEEAERDDIIQAIVLGRPERQLAFCRGLQAGCPVDSHVVPEPWRMPGYEDSVIMAGGGFVQGGTLELSADGPVRPPYAVYVQGGLFAEHAYLALTEAAEAVARVE